MFRFFRGVQVFMLLTVLPGPAVLAATFTVDSARDVVDAVPGDGVCDTGSSPGVEECTLRAAVMEANALTGLDIIKLPADVYTLSLAETGGDSGGDLLSTDELRIEGSEGAVIDADNLSRVLRTTAPLEVSRVVLRNGTTGGSGGCVQASTADLTLRYVEVWQCQADATGGGVYWFGFAPDRLVLEEVWIHSCQASNGGGLKKSGTGAAIISRSTFNANYADVGEGGGAVLQDGESFINNSTIYFNSAERDGGGLVVWGRLQLNSSTITNNFADLGADGFGTGGGVSSIGPVGYLVSRNSIIANNYVVTSGIPIFAPDDCNAPFSSLGYNLVGHPDAACTGFGPANNDLIGPGLDPELGSFGDNGGSTPTLVPDATSPAVDGGNPAGCLVDVDGDWATAATAADRDQRGFERTVDGDGTAGSRCDIGSTEYGATGPVFEDGFESGDTGQWSSTVP